MLSMVSLMKVSTFDFSYAELLECRDGPGGGGTSSMSRSASLAILQYAGEEYSRSLCVQRQVLCSSMVLTPQLRLRVHVERH